MIGYDFIILSGFFIGAVLYALLMIEAVKRQNKLFHEYIFISVAAILFSWHALQFMVLFLKYSFGLDALDVYSTLSIWSLYIVAFLPPVLVQLHAAFLGHLYQLGGTRSHLFRTLPMITYLPIFGILYFSQYTIVNEHNFVLSESLSVIPVYIFWLVICMMISAGISTKIYLVTKNQKWRQFFGIEIIILVATASLLIYLYFFGGTGNVNIDKSLKSILMASSVAPTLIMIYLLYKYPFYSSVARIRFLYITVAGLFIILFIIVSKSVSQVAEENPSVNENAIIVIVVTVLIILYEPTRNMLRKMVGYYALSEKADYQLFVRQISEKLLNVSDIENLAKTVCTAIKEKLQVNETALFMIRRTNDGTNGHYEVESGFGDIKDFPMKKVVKRFQKSQVIYEVPFSVNQIAEPPPYQIYVTITVEGQLVGVLCVGKKITFETFSFEEKELMQTLVSQVSLAIENIELTNRRLELETRMFQADKLSTIGMLSTSIAHEVKNPLSSIKSIVQSMVEELKSKKGNKDQIEDLRIIQEEIDRLSSVVSQLLRFANPREAIVDKLDVIKLIENVLVITRHELSRNNISVLSNFSHRPLCLQMRDQDLKEIIFNIVLNAIQAMSDGGKLYVNGCYVESKNIDSLTAKPIERVNRWYIDGNQEDYEIWNLHSINAHRIQDLADSSTQPEVKRNENHNAVKLCFIDTGKGMSEDQLTDAFKPFHTTKETGTGLGMVIIKNKIEAINGRLRIRSEEGIGTAFEIYIPLK